MQMPFDSLFDCVPIALMDALAIVRQRDVTHTAAMAAATAAAVVAVVGTC